MYCKFCGKQIDTDSTFCKYCGKMLDCADIISDRGLNYHKLNYVILAVMIIGYIFMGYCSLPEYDYSRGDTIIAYTITPFLIILLYRFYITFCKYHILIYNKFDSPKVKLLKHGLIIYTFVCLLFGMNGGDVDAFYAILSVIWIIPTIVIGCIYYYKQHRQAIK